jgi:hypothetical protein
LDKADDEGEKKVPVTSNQVSELYEELRKHYATMHSKMRKEDRVFNQHFDGLVDVPYEVRIFQSSTASNIVEGFRNQIRTTEPTVDFRPAGNSVAAEKHSSLMKRWGYGQMRKERTMSVLDPNLQCGFDLLLRGAACKKIIVDVDSMMEAPPKRGSNAFKEWEARAYRTWPFITRAIDPLSIFPSPGTKKPCSFIIERQTRYAGEIMDLYPDWKNPEKKQSPTRAIEWLEYWSDDQYLAMADGVQVFDRDNPYKIVPYIFEWSGMGRNDSDNDPAKMAVGILSSIIGELEEEVRLKTAISVQTQMHVFPPILTVEDPRKVAKEFGVGPGKVIRHPPGHPPQYMQYPAPNENMYRFLDVIQGNISRVHSMALSGGRESGVRYGVLQAQMIGQALTTISPILGTIDVIGTRSLNMMIALARELDLNMAIEGSLENTEPSHRLSGKDFTHENFAVSFEAVDPAENDRALLVGESLRRNGDISRRTLWTKYAKHVVEDPDDEELNLLEEKVMEMLVASGQLGQAVLSEDVQEQMAEQAEQAVMNQEQMITQDRTVESMPQAAAAEAAELEAISGRPGSHTIPRDVAEQGMAAASPTRSGLPQR